MAKKKQQNTAEEAKAKTVARIKRTEAYAERVRTLFAATVNEILALNKKMPTLEAGEMFSFDNTSKKMQFEVERLLRQLHSVATMAIQQGIKLEWAQANAECDKLVQSCFGKQVLNTPEFTAWTQRNESAMAAFIARSEKGMNLSQRVWRSCRQLRDEMEVAITCSIGDGTSAATMSRQVRQYLNDPDLMFRRFRYKAGEEAILDDDGNEVGKKIIWGKKWKKKIKKPDGTVGWIDYDKDSYRDEWTGPGYYKSSAQNAMRMTRTETNIAYRRADQARWAQMDFVLGQRVHLSRSHPKKDICDKLAGDYPKDFVFDGWHPQCFCYVTPILIDEDERAKEQDALLAGKEYKPRGKRITEYPENFKEWVRENEDRIMSAHDFGTDPYFVRNNFSAVRDILNPKKKLTPLEIAEQRHADRTPEQEETIRLKWQERQERIAAEKAKIEAERKRIEQINKTAQNVLASLKKNFDGFDFDTSALDIAIESGDSKQIQIETRNLAKQLSEQKKQVNQNAKSVLSSASNFVDFANHDDVTALQNMLNTGEVSKMNQAVIDLKQKIADVKQQAQAMNAIVPNAEQWLDQFSVADIQAAHDSVVKKLADISHLPIDEQIKKLENEIKYVADPTYLKPHKIFPTWKVAQAAYAKAFDEANYKLAVESAQKELDVLKIYSAAHPKATTVATAIVEAEALIASGSDINLINAKILYAQKRKEAQEKASAKKASKVSGAVTYAELSDAKRKKLLSTFNSNDVDEVDDLMRPTSEEQWKNLTDEEKLLLTKYTQTYSYLNEPLRNIPYCGDHKKKAEFANDMPKITAALSKCRTKQDMIVRRGTYDYPIPELGVDAYGKATHNLSDVKVGDTFTDGAFLSTANHRDKGFFMTYNLIIYVPKGSQGIFAEPFTHYNGNSYDYASNYIWNGTDKASIGREFEWIGQRGCRFKVVARSGNEIHLLLIGQLFTQPTGPQTP